VKICFNTANFVGRLVGYRFAMSDWMTLHQRTAAETDGTAFAGICREIADAGYTAVELWQALAEPTVMTEESAKERRAILDDHGLAAVGYGGYLGTGAEKVCPWLGIEHINGGFSLEPSKATALCMEHGVKTNFENHPQRSVDEILAPIGGGNEWLGVCLDLGWLGTMGVNGPDTIRKLGPLVRWVHAKDVREAGRHDTCMLGDGVADIAGCIGALNEIGYDGWLSWEDEPEDRNPMESAVENRLWLERKLAALR
jgi:sugar phosphate isomerase/epimerase